MPYQKDKLPEWNKSQFLTFVLLYCANIDMAFDEKEKAMVKKLLDKAHYLPVKEVFDSCNDSQCLDLIKQFKGIYYPTIAQKDELLDKMKKLFLVDEEYSDVEHGIMIAMRRVL